jgi:hypothetical protein
MRQRLGLVFVCVHSARPPAATPSFTLTLAVHTVHAIVEVIETHVVSTIRSNGWRERRGEKGGERKRG